MDQNIWLSDPVGPPKLFFSYSTRKSEPSPPKKSHIHAHPFYLLKLGQIPGLTVSWGDHSVRRHQDLGPAAVQADKHGPDVLGELEVVGVGAEGEAT